MHPGGLAPKGLPADADSIDMGTALDTDTDTGAAGPAMDVQVREANRAVYNSKTIEDYDQNQSIFNPRQRQRIRGILEGLRDRTGGDRFLDVGCGTGNLIRIAGEVFPHAFGVDQAEQLLARVARRDAITGLSAAPAHRLPFATSTFDGVGMYALLHHLYDPLPALAEAHRVLKPGGILYTDHDPNRYFSRFYHALYRLKNGARPGFGTDLEDLAEYHNIHTSGLDPEALRRALVKLGFSDVEIRYRHSTNPGFAGFQAFAARCLEVMSRLIPLKSFYTHFMIFARK